MEEYTITYDSKKIEFSIEYCDICDEFTSCIIVHREKICKNCIEHGFKEYRKKHIAECKNCENLISIKKSVQFEDPKSSEIWCFCDERCQEQYLTSLDLKEKEE